jgi:hypothetical protein
LGKPNGACRAIHRTRLSHLKEQGLGRLLEGWPLEDHYTI